MCIRDRLKVFNIPTDDFEKLDICRSFTSLSEFDQFLKDLDSADDPERFYSQVSSDYIEIDVYKRQILTPLSSAISDNSFRSTGFPL